MSTPKTYPFTWTKCSQKEQEEYDSIYVAEKSFYRSMIKSSPMDLMAPCKLEWNAEKIWNFKPRKDDIWIVTYPKCGTTLTQEIVWQIAHGVDLESEESKKPILVRSPFLELSMLVTSPPPPPDAVLDEKAKFFQDSGTWTETMKSPRIIKSHLPLAMLPPNLLDTAKVIYVGRNPKDACVSFFHMDKLMSHHGMREDYEFEEYATKIYMKGKVVYGSYWEHVNDAWQYRNHHNLKILWYEDMMENLSKVIQDIADFTNCKISTEQIQKLAEHCNIEKFKKNDAVNMKPAKGSISDEAREKFNFIRKGQVGDWMNYFKDETKLKEFEQWIDNNNVFKIPIKYTN